MYSHAWHEYVTFMHGRVNACVVVDVDTMCVCGSTNAPDGSATIVQSRREKEKERERAIEEENVRNKRHYEIE